MMVILIDRTRAFKAFLLVVLCMAVGVFWTLDGPTRLSSVPSTKSQRIIPVTTGHINLQPHMDPNPAPNNDESNNVATSHGKIEVKVPLSAAVFDEYRLDRDRARSAQIELLKAALNEKNLSDTRREQLTSELFSLLKRGEAELQAETLLKAKGFTDAVVVLTQTGANPVIADILEQDDAAKVGELVARATGVSLERITIIDGASS